MVVVASYNSESATNAYGSISSDIVTATGYVQIGVDKGLTPSNIF